MPDIDVTDVLLDPVVAGSTFTVLRRQEVVDNYGISRVVTTTFPGVVGAVQPGGDNALMRESDYDAQARGITVLTSFRLRGPSALGASDYKPDRILWAGDTYEIRNLEDYSVFGAGFMKAECAQITFLGTPAGPPLVPGAWSLDFSKNTNSALAHGAGAC